MADGVFNISKGHINEYVDRIDGNDPTNSVLTIVLLQAAEADGTLEDYDDLSTLLGQPGNTEANFTNYGRKELDDGDLTPSTVDDTNNRKESTFPNQTWTAAGGASNNNLVKLLVCYDSDSLGGTDANIIPLTHHDFVVSTNGGDLTAQVPVQGFFRAS